MSPRGNHDKQKKRFLESSSQLPHSPLPSPAPPPDNPPQSFFELRRPLLLAGDKLMEDAGLDFLLYVIDIFLLQEEFADSLEHSDPVPPAVLRTGEANPTVPAKSNAGSGCGQQVGVAGPEEAQGGMHRRCEASPTRSAKLTDRVNPRRQGRPEAEAMLRSLPVYLLTTHRPPMWLLCWFDQRTRAWFWCSENKCNGGNCRVRWDVVCRPKLLGGLGLQDMNKLSGALAYVGCG